MDVALGPAELGVKLGRDLRERVRLRAPLLQLVLGRGAQPLFLRQLRGRGSVHLEKRLWKMSVGLPVCAQIPPLWRQKPPRAD